MNLLQELRDPRRRSETVLWFRGTGMNAWAYFAFLENFTVSELGEFKQIIGVSGGAGIVWLYVCWRERGQKLTLIKDFDRHVRTIMNRAGWRERFTRVLTRKSPYLASEHLRLLDSLVDPLAADWKFGDFPLANFRVLTSVKPGTYREFGGAADAALQVTRAVAAGGTPEAGQDIRIEPQHSDASYFDFEFATSSIRAAYRENLVQRFPECRIVVVNTRINREMKGMQYVRLGDDRWPRLMQTIDAFTLFLNLPWGRSAKTLRKARRTYRPPGDFGPTID